MNSLTEARFYSRHNIRFQIFGNVDEVLHHIVEILHTDVFAFTNSDMLERYISDSLDFRPRHKVINYINMVRNLMRRIRHNTIVNEDGTLFQIMQTYYDSQFPIYAVYHHILLLILNLNMNRLQHE